MPGDSSLIPIDQSIIDEISFICDPGINSYKIDFQFPPKITQEGNSSNWEEHDLWAIEPLKIHKGSAGRNLTMKWEYLATDSEWDCDRIADQLRQLKAYFFEFKRERYPVATIAFGEVIPDDINFRILSVDVAYSEELVINNGALHPLHTVVTVKLELATTINDLTSGEKKLVIPPLGDVVMDWY